MSSNICRIWVLFSNWVLKYHTCARFEWNTFMPSSILSRKKSRILQLETEFCLSRIYMLSFMFYNMHLIKIGTVYWTDSIVVWHTLIEGGDFVSDAIIIPQGLYVGIFEYLALDVHQHMLFLQYSEIQEFNLKSISYIRVVLSG